MNKKNLIQKLKLFIIFTPKDDYEDGYNDGVKDVIDEVNDSLDEWIPAKWPSCDHEDVLIDCDKGIIIGYYNADDGVWYDKDFRSEVAAVAWMTLPERYNKE